MKKIIKISIIIFLYACYGCASKIKNVDGISCASLLDPFLLKSETAMTEIFYGFSEEKKYAALICGNQNVHPPLMFVADLYAKDGSSAVPFLKQKLEVANADLTIRDIFLVFKIMQRRGDYDVIHDRNLLELIDKRTSGIKDEFWRESIRDSLNKLKADFADKPFKTRK